MRKLFVMAALALAAACGDSTSAASVSGTYNLQTVNGSVLPYVFQASNPKIEIISEQMVLNSNGTFTITDVERTTPTGGSPSNATFSETGTWSLSGNTITVHFTSDNSTSVAQVSGNTLTVAESGFTLVFLKQ